MIRALPRAAQTPHPPQSTPGAALLLARAPDRAINGHAGLQFHPRCGHPRQAPTYEITADLARGVAASGNPYRHPHRLRPPHQRQPRDHGKRRPQRRRDLEQFFERLVPEDTPWFDHTTEGPDDMPSHIRMTLTAPARSSPSSPAASPSAPAGRLSSSNHRRAPHHRQIVCIAPGQ
jgi:hypothetical protein